MNDGNASNPREPSMSWSMKAESGGNPDSPGRISANDFSNRASSNAANVSRGDSLAYSEDSMDQRNLIKGNGKPGGAKPCCQQRNNQRNDEKIIRGQNVIKPPINDSLMSDDSLREKGKAACCVLQ